MPIIRPNESTRLDLREHLDDIRTELLGFKDRKRDLDKTIEESFTDDGAITQAGLESRMAALDIFRRTSNPLDSGEQCLINGQQNEIAHLMQFEATLLHEKANILERINELEATMQSISMRLQQ